MSYLTLPLGACPWKRSAQSLFLKSRIHTDTVYTLLKSHHFSLCKKETFFLPNVVYRHTFSLKLPQIFNSIPPCELVVFVLYICKKISSPHDWYTFTFSLNILYSTEIIILILTITLYHFKMERKQGFFSALKEEVVRGLSPSKSRAKSPARSHSPMSGLLRRRKSRHVANPDPLIARSGSLRPLGETLTPLMEGPDPDGGDVGGSKRVGLGQWMKGQLARAPSSTVNACKHSDLGLLLGVMGAPLAPVHVSTTDPFPHLSIKDTPIVSLSLSLISLYLSIYLSDIRFLSNSGFFNFTI